MWELLALGYRSLGRYLPHLALSSTSTNKTMLKQIVLRDNSIEIRRNRRVSKIIQSKLPKYVRVVARETRLHLRSQTYLRSSLFSMRRLYLRALNYFFSVALTALAIANAHLNTFTMWRPGKIWASLTRLFRLT